MDSEKTGKRILRLRREKGCLKKQPADALHLSDKTLSKWERGRSGETPDRRAGGKQDGGNMKKIRFFICPVCGGVISAQGDVSASCCGRKLAALPVRPADEEHRLKKEVVEDDYYLTFCHEMKKEHYLNFIAYVTYDRFLLVRLYPEQGSEVRIPRMSPGKLYCGCKKHGVFVME